MRVCQKPKLFFVRLLTRSAPQKKPLGSLALMTQLESAGPAGSSHSEFKGPGDLFRCRVGTAHLAIALVAVLCVTGSVDLWPRVRAGGQPLEVDSPAQRVAWAALAYLAITALTELRASWLLRRAQTSGGPVAARGIGAHLVVLVAAAVAIARGFHSLALLAGLCVILSALVTVSLITSIVDFFERRALHLAAGQERQLGHEAISAPALMWLVPLWAAAVFVVGTLFYLEEQPLPHNQLPAAVESPAGDDVENESSA